MQYTLYDIPSAGSLDLDFRAETHVLVQLATRIPLFPLSCCLVSYNLAFTLPETERLPIQAHSSPISSLPSLLFPLNVSADQRRRSYSRLGSLLSAA